MSSFSNAERILVLTSKNDSALLYHLLEAHEGLAAYSTVEHSTVLKLFEDPALRQKIGEFITPSAQLKPDQAKPDQVKPDQVRLVELWVPIGFILETKELLAEWSSWVLVIDELRVHRSCGS